MSAMGQYSLLTGRIKNQTRPMTEVQHIHNDQHWHTSFSSNAQNPSVHAEPSVYSAVQTLGTNMIPNAGKRKFRFTPHLASHNAPPYFVLKNASCGVGSYLRNYSTILIQFIHNATAHTV